MRPNGNFRRNLSLSEDVVKSIKANGLLLHGELFVENYLIFEPPVTLSYAKVFSAVFGSYTYFDVNCRIKNVDIGRYCSFADNIIIGPGGHPSDNLTTSPAVGGHYFDWFSKSDHYEQNALPKRTVIGNDVWIGTGALIMDGVTLGDGCIIGAHSVITKDVEPYSVVAGVPGRKIKSRFSDAIISRLLDLKLWRYDLRSCKDPKGVLRGALDSDKISHINEMIHNRVLSLMDRRHYCLEPTETKAWRLNALEI